MIQTVHLPLACAQAIYLNRKKAGVVETLVHAAGNHLLLDFIPHAEPSFFSTSYLDTFSLAWFLAAVDNLTAFAVFALVIWNIKESRSWRVAPLAALAWGPDFIVALYTKGVLTNAWAKWFTEGHSLTHALWKPWFTYPVAWWGWVIGISTSSTVLFFTGWYLWHVLNPRRLHVPIPVSYALSHSPATD